MTINMRVSQLQKALIAPAAAITNPAERRRVRLLTGLIVFVAGALISGAIAGQVPSLFIGAGLALVAYGLSRTVYYRLGAILTLIALEYPSIAYVVSQPALPEVDFYASYIWFGLALVLVSFWLLPGYTILITLVNIAIIVVTTSNQPAIGDVTIILFSGYMGSLGGVAALGSFLQAQNLRRIEQQRLALEERTHQLAEKNRDLQVARAEALEADRTKTEFLATMSHELRTPLTAILGFSELLITGLKGEINPGQQDYLQRIQRNGESLLGLVNDVLDISKLEARRLDVHPQSIELRPFITQLATRMEPLADGLDFTYTLTDDLPTHITTDPDHLERIIVNLLSNAFKFTDAGTVELAVTRPTPQHWRFRITDTGVGIPPHARDTIFEPFRQADPTATRRHGGTGLGLAIVHHLVRILDGRIILESQLGEGSSFTVELPITPE